MQAPALPQHLPRLHPPPPLAAAEAAVALEVAAVQEVAVGQAPPVAAAFPGDVADNVGAAAGAVGVARGPRVLAAVEAADLVSPAKA